MTALTNVTFSDFVPRTFPICVQHKVPDLPFLAFYRDGALIHTLVGLNESEVVEQINRLVASAP